VSFVWLFGNSGSEIDASVLTFGTDFWFPRKNSWLGFLLRFLNDVHATIEKKLQHSSEIRDFCQFVFSKAAKDYRVIWLDFNHEISAANTHANLLFYVCRYEKSDIIMCQESKRFYPEADRFHYAVDKSCLDVFALNQAPTMILLHLMQAWWVGKLTWQTRHLYVSMNHIKNLEPQPAARKFWLTCLTFIF